jgi:two-component system CheB/CheR fusion protein
VAIGVSAGGLEPLRAIVSRLVTTKATFFVIPHFSPDATTVMDVILGQASHLKVSKASQGLVIKKGHVYLIPPGATLKAADGQFVLGSHKREDLPQYPIDIAYESISKNFGDRAIAVILSGAGTDGAKGAARIHQAGGTVLVQDPATAEFDGMPNSVINTDSVHEVLAPEKISEYLNSLATDPDDGTSLLIHEKRFEYLDRVIRLLRGEGFDFRRYKPDILIRRIERRKELLLCKSDRDYIQLLEQSSDELASLCQDFLIAVTSFFKG